MIRLINICVIAALVFAAADVYKIKFESIRQAERLAKLRMEVRQRREAIASLRAEWSKLVGSLVPEPVKRRWSRQFMDGLEFRGWGMRVAIPILAMVVFGVAVVVLTGVKGGTAGPTPPSSALGFPPATLAGNDFTATPNGTITYCRADSPSKPRPAIRK